MARPKSTAIQQRDQIIMAELQAGKLPIELANKYGITRARIAQIVTEQSQLLPDNEERAMLTVVMLGMSAELTKDFYTLQPSPFLTVKGEVVVNPDTGEVIYDNISLQKVKNDTSKSVIAIQESLRKMHALDQPKKIELHNDEARANIDEWLQEVDEEYRVVRNIKGEYSITDAAIIPEDHDDDHTPGTDLEA